MADYLIVGAGLAGIAVAEKLLQKSYTVCVYDEGGESASAVAGGVMNPVILKRFTLAWNADEQLKKANDFYSSLENKLNESFFFRLPVFRKFNSVEEQNNWFLAADKPSLEPFLNTDLVKEINEFIPAPFGFGKVNGTGILDTEKLLKAYREFLIENELFVSEKFDYNQVKLSSEACFYKQEKYLGIIFCEGMGLNQNPFFNYLPLRGNKGEYIIIHAPRLNLEKPIKSSIFILPLGNDLYKIGATYNNIDKTSLPTKGAGEFLRDKISRLLLCDFEVVGQVAGIRPASADRRPLLGAHPKYKNLFCCNGFGSRGVLVAPTAAELLLDFIENKNPLPSEIDISRFQKRY